MKPPVIRILLVEDDSEDAEITRDVLQSVAGSRSLEVVWTSSFDEGLEVLRRGPFDVCLLDYYLGPNDGLTFIDGAIAAGVTVPIILLTGRSNEALESRALAAGACDYLTKSDLAPALLERSIRHSIERGRKLAELRASERRFRALFDHALDGMVICDDEARFIDGNPPALELLGVTSADLPKLGLADVTSPDAMSTWQKFLAEGRFEGDLVLRRATGETFTAEVRAVASILPSNHLCMLRDITDRRSAEKYQVRLASIVDAADDAIDGMTPDGTINFWSTGAERLYGYTTDEVLGRSHSILLPPDHVATLEDVLARVRAGETVRHWESKRQGRDGTLFDTSSTLAPIRENGRTIGISVVTRNLTAKKRLENQIAISDRMASVGTLAAGVAHEINNPLAAVLANLDMIEEELERDESERGASQAVLEMLTDVRAGAERIKHTVRDLRLFSRPDEEHREAIDVAAILESSARMAWNEIRHRAQLYKEFGDSPRVWGNASRLGQVVLHLIVNAAHSIAEGNATRNEIRLVTRSDEAGRAVIEVRDSGAGIAPEHLERLFEPFFTTKPIGVGTGLGLSICQRIVHEMGGTITAKSALGVGTTFRVTLPAAPVQEGTTRAALKTTRQPPTNARVLVVDDDPMILTAVDRTLRNEHQITTVSAAREALAIITGGERFSVIICDVMMPNMTGIEFLDRLRAVSPDQADAVVFLTGGAFTPNAAALLDQVGNERIDKPFNPSELRAAVRRRVRDGHA